MLKYSDIQIGTYNLIIRRTRRSQLRMRRTWGSSRPTVTTSPLNCRLENLTLTPWWRQQAWPVWNLPTSGEFDWN